MITLLHQQQKLLLSLEVKMNKELLLSILLQNFKNLSGLFMDIYIKAEGLMDQSHLEQKLWCSVAGQIFTRKS